MCIKIHLKPKCMYTGIYTYVDVYEFMGSSVSVSVGGRADCVPFGAPRPRLRALLRYTTVAQRGLPQRNKGP